MFKFFAFLIKTIFTVVLLVFVLGFGVIGLCAMNDQPGGGMSLIAVLVLLVAGAGVLGLFRLIFGLWKRDEQDRAPPTDES